MAQTGYARKAPGRHSYGEGLILEVSPKGKSVWKLRTKVAGRDTLRKLGEASSHQNVHWARARAADAKVTDGQVIATNSLGFYLTEWAEFKERTGHWDSRHHSKTIGRLQKSLGPYWSKPVTDLRRVDLVTHLETLDSRDTAGRVYVWCAECLETLVDRGLLTHSVLGRKPDTLKVSKRNRQPRKSYGTNYTALAALYRKFKLSDLSRSVRLGAMFVIYSGMRINEVLAMRVDYVDGKRMIVPRSVMKERDHWRGDFELPLIGIGAEIVEQALEGEKNGWLFPNQRGNRNVTDAAIEKQFRLFSNGECQPHGVRKSLRTFAMEECKARTEVANACIDHATSTGADVSYDAATYVKERQKIMRRWAKLFT